MRRLAPLALLALLARPVSAGGGFAEIRFSALPGAAGRAWTLVERLRPNLELSLGPRVKLVSVVELAFAQGRDPQQVFQDLIDESDFGPLLDLAGCVWPAPPRNRLLRIDGSDDYLDIDRLHLDVYLPWLDLRVGRQALNWGSAQLVNPTDPFPEVLFTEPWRPRRGVNAVRALFPLADNADITAIVATNDAFDALRFATRVRGRVAGVDVAAVAAWRGDEGDEGGALVGLDVRGTLGVGYWFEGALHLRERVWEELAVGVDYSFPVLERLMLMAQYYRSGAQVEGRSVASSITPPECDLPEGVQAPDFLATPAAPDPFAPPFSGHDYLLVSVSLGVVQELSVSVAGLQNLNDGTGFLVPTLGFRPVGWFDLSASAQVPYRLGRSGGEFKPSAEDLRIEQDLGPLGVRVLDLSGLVPDAVVTVWTRLSF